MTRSTFMIPSMDCPAEEAVIRNRLKSVKGVDELHFDLFNRRLTVSHSLSDETTIVSALKSVGMEPRIGNAKNDQAERDRERHTHGSSNAAQVEEGAACDPGVPCGTDVGPGEEQAEPVATRKELVLLGMSGVLAFAAEGLYFAGIKETAWPVVTLAIASMLLGGLPTLKKGLVALKTLTLNINFLMTVAVIGAAAIGAWPEAAMVVFLFAVAELIEAHSLERARDAVRGLMAMAPEVANVKTSSAESADDWKTIAVESVAVGSIVRVKPGERLPLDGIVVAGSSAVNQAPITGESIPVDKAVDDHVYAGSINGNGHLEFKTTGGKDQTTIARIVRSVQEAQGQRAPTQRFVDSFAKVYTPIVVVLAALIAVVPWLVFQQPFSSWLYKALVLLVIACPCALVISTPVTIVSGLTAAAKRGILIKGGVYLEQGRHLTVVALDKTGTITEGLPRLTDVTPVNETGAIVTKEEVLRIAASIDSLSDHPVARAISSAWDGNTEPLFRVEEFRSVTGRGVQGVVNGEMYFVGNHRFLHERGVCTPSIEAKLERLEIQGKTAVILSSSSEVLGLLAVADTPRETSMQAIVRLHEAGIRVVMLTGDNQKTADAIAKKVSIDIARGELLPEDKLKAIDELLAQHGQSAVGMVGDGINDAPALAKASIGFAMGAAGTDTAIETADVAFMRDDLLSLPEYVSLSRRTARMLKQNIGLALGIKLVFFVLAIAGVATLWMAVLADVGASLFVVFNGLRLLRWRPRQ
ncbi:MAG: heavy metal translocating P-type ATPase [Phycisphaerae bacterium]|nr:heavy metal translocating P-type ATPase [Phycisphaerae bacterium]MBM90186.1 heavy metal translocating P-type ATPase [Phycisphaerae bacterium]